MGIRTYRFIDQMLASIALLSTLALVCCWNQPRVEGAQVNENAAPPPKARIEQARRPTTIRAPAAEWSSPSSKRRQATPEQITQFLKDLGDNSFNVRESAGKALLEVGSPAMKGLKHTLHTADPEVRRRVEDLIGKIEIDEACAPSFVTLNLVNTSVPDAVVGLGRQSRFNLDLIPQQGPAREQLEEKKLNLTLDAVPFWEALEQVCDAADLVYAFAGPTTLRLQLSEGRPPFRTPTTCAGPFRLRVTGMKYYRDLNMAEQGAAQQPNAPAFPPQAQAVPQQFANARLLRNESLSVSMDLLAEPHITVLNVGNPEVTEAESERGESLVPSSATIPNNYPPPYYGPPIPMQVRQALFQLRPATKPAAKLKVLRLRVPVEVLVKGKPLITVDNLLSSNGKIFKGEGDVALAILHVQEHGNARQGNIRVFMTGIDRADTNALNPNLAGGHLNNSLYQHRFEVTDAQGQRYNLNFNSNYVNPNAQNDKSLEGTLSFSGFSPNIGPVARLTYSTHRTVRTFALFELRNVPMP